jgi:hypothetical protein
MSNRLDQEREKKLQPTRVQHALKKLFEIGIEPITIDSTKIVFEFKGEKIQFFPYSGWHTGKSIKDGRGLKNLLKQLK